MSGEVKAILAKQLNTIQKLSTSPYDLDLITELLERDLTLPKGVAPGRLLLIPHANSFAYYLIQKIEGNSVRVKHLMVQNGYKAPSVFDRETPVWYAQQLVGMRDLLR